jgi:hypothetical protein
MWKLLRKILRKKDKMENLQEIDLEMLDKELKPFFYKWTKGDNNGQVCEYESLFKDPASGIIWINFKGGTRINYNVMSEYMIEIDPIPQSNSTNQLQPITKAQNSRIPVQDQFPVKNVMLADNRDSKVIDENPIVSLLQKQKPNWVEVGIKLKLNLPTKNLYNVLTSSFEDAENEIIEFVVNDLDLEIIKESLRINIKEIYKGNHANIRKPGTDLNKEEQED